MHCNHHFGRDAVGCCVIDGKPYCDDCLTDVDGKFYHHGNFKEYVLKINESSKTLVEEANAYAMEQMNEARSDMEKSIEKVRTQARTDIENARVSSESVLKESDRQFSEKYAALELKHSGPQKARDTANHVVWTFATLIVLAMFVMFVGAKIQETLRYDKQFFGAPP